LRQALKTPFHTNPILREAIDPSSPSPNFDQLLEGTFVEDVLMDSPISHIEATWIKSLQRKITDEIPLMLTVTDFKAFFRSKQECSASLPSEQHMGHCKAMLECIRRDNPFLPEIINNNNANDYFNCA